MVSAFPFQALKALLYCSEPGLPPSNAYLGTFEKPQRNAESELHTVAEDVAPDVEAEISMAVVASLHVGSARKRTANTRHSLLLPPGGTVRALAGARRRHLCAVYPAVAWLCIADALGSSSDSRSSTAWKTMACVLGAAARHSFAAGVDAAERKFGCRLARRTAGRHKAAGRRHLGRLRRAV